MKLDNIYNILNAEIPHALSDRYVAAYGGHDNSGILLNTGEEIERAVFSSICPVRRSNAPLCAARN